MFIITYGRALHRLRLIYDKWLNLQSFLASCRRVTGLKNASSEKVENDTAATVLWFMYDNFYRVWQALSVDPAMDAGFSAHAWSKEELANVLLPKSLAA